MREIGSMGRLEIATLGRKREYDEIDVIDPVDANKVDTLGFEGFTYCATKEGIESRR
jgi:hypothetical protein